MPNFNIPVPLGNTPLYERYLEDNRLLASMPFTFHYMPYLAYTVSSYSPVAFYEKLADMLAYISSSRMILLRLKNATSPFSAAYDTVKALGNRQMIKRLRQLLDMLRTDPQSRRFHEHETDVLPEFYHHQYERTLGPYAGLMSREDRRPVLIGHKKNDLVAAKG